MWRLTGQPASVFGITGRGFVRAGGVADLVAFDPATVGVGRRRRVRDLPAGAERLVVDSEGVELVLVAGEAIVQDGRPVDGAAPGRVLRGRAET